MFILVTLLIIKNAVLIDLIVNILMVFTFIGGIILLIKESRKERNIPGLALNDDKNLLFDSSQLSHILI